MDKQEKATHRPERRAEIRNLKRRLEEARGRLASLERRIESGPGGRARRGLCARVDPERCDACGTCERACPFEAVVMERTARVLPERCRGCGLCVKACPRGAVRLGPIRRPAERRAMVAG